MFGEATCPLWSPQEKYMGTNEKIHSAYVTSKSDFTKIDLFLKHACLKPIRFILFIEEDERAQ